MASKKIQHVMHRCANCHRSVSKLLAEPLECSCGCGEFVVDLQYRPDLEDRAADQLATARAAKASAGAPANGKHHPLFSCETCKDSKTVIVALGQNGNLRVGAANRLCPDCEATAVGT